MRVDRRSVIRASLPLLFLSGCLGNGSLPTSFDLRIENQDDQPRELAVVVDHMREQTVYDETVELDPGEQRRESAVAEKPGRYRIGVVDTTTDDEWTAETQVELSTGRDFCGWFTVRAESESVLASVPRCPNNDRNQTTTGTGSEP